MSIKTNKLDLRDAGVRKTLKRELMKWYYNALSSGKIKNNHKTNPPAKAN